MKTLTATEARKRLCKLLDEVEVTSEPARITGRRTSAVLVSEADWRALQETVYLSSIPGMVESIRDGLATPVEDGAEELDRRPHGGWSTPAMLAKMPASWRPPGSRRKPGSCSELSRRTRFASLPPFEKLVGDLSGADSRRINIQHRLVYQVLEEERVVKVLRLWTHYE